jgi:hypothetical protein
VKHSTLLLLTAAVATLGAQSAKVELEVVNPEIIHQRLEMVKRKLRDRRETLDGLFREVGCAALSSQPVPRSNEPNVICEMPAQSPTARTIVVGGHFDLASVGDGAVDDWSGASLLPSLYQSLAKHPRRHRFVLVGFAAEETGLFGSKEFVKKLNKADRAAVAAMVNLECLGLAAPTFWASRADKRLGAAYLAVARNLGLQPAGTNIDDVGIDDSFPFTDAKIPVISFHSVTQNTLAILHSPRDTIQAIDRKHYYDAYRLASLYLAYIDTALD